MMAGDDHDDADEAQFEYGNENDNFKTLPSF
jgi:hypothetical protein